MATVGGSAHATATVTSWAASDVRVNTPFDGDVGRYETAVAIDPLAPSRIVAAVIDLNWITDHPAEYSNIRFYRSLDSGATWTDLGYSPFGDSGDPQLVFDGHGNLYTSDVGGAGLQVARSADGGSTWSVPVTVDPDRGGVATLDPSCGFGDKEELAVDRASGDVYVLWSHTQLGCFTPSADGDHTTIYASRSIDAGATWSAWSQVSEPAGTFSLGVAPAVGPDGTLYAAYLTQRPITSPFDCPALYPVTIEALQHNPAPPLTEDIVLAASHDHGDHWTYTHQNFCDTTAMRVVKRYTKNGTYVDGPMPTITVDPASGAAIVAYSNTTLNGMFEIRVTRSTDRGATWTTPRPVLGGPNDTDDFEFPSLTAQAGTLWLQYLDSRPDGTFHYRVRESTDDGATFGEPFTLTSAASAGAPQGGTDIGDYQWIDSIPGHVVSIWTDHRRGDSAPNDVYVRVGTF